MPIKIPNELPAVEILQNENIFIMPEERALHQDIRSLEIVILNLMPTKIITETQILRLLGNSPLQVDVVLLHPESHQSQNTSAEHLKNFYNTFSDIKNRKFDGMIITGAPVERLNFSEVDYWEELKEIMNWSRHNVFSTLHICWGAQAGLFHHYNIPKYPLDNKLSGIFEHTISHKNVKLLRGFDDKFFAPHSRYTSVKKSDIQKIDRLHIISESEKAGVYIIINDDGRQVFVTGHPEYDRDTLKKEYKRDVNRGLDLDLPDNYFSDDDPEQEPVVKWRSHASLLYNNWLNYYVYQETPFDINRIM